jgi:uncharacterized protein YndB with AHSA1/START domain
MKRFRIIAVNCFFSNARNMTTYKKTELEYMFRCSPGVLYSFLSEPSGLSEWFCDDVNIQAGWYNFMWNKDSEQRAKLLQSKENVMIKYRWEDSPETTYFEFRIQVDDITGEVALMITDFSEDDDESETILFWNNATQRLHRVIGS